MMLSYWIYILIGNDKTGKTTFQKRLLYHLTGKNYKSLHRNITIEITHPYAPKKLLNIFTMNRSYQETKSEYKNIKNYFRKYFHEADVCILSSHSHNPCLEDIKEMIVESKKRFYNVAGVFFSNAINRDVKEIVRLNWDEILYIQNPRSRKQKVIEEQIDLKAKEFSEMLIRRASIQ